MTQVAQTSVFTHSRLYSKRDYPGNIYSVVINCEDGEFYEYEVEADTFAKATEIAEQMALDLMADITIIEVYKAA
jgi:hypothetical protein